MSVIEAYEYELAMTQGELSRALMAIERVRYLHTSMYKNYCDYCELLWPCETIEALDGKL